MNIGSNHHQPSEPYKVLDAHIGTHTTIPGWPPQTIEGLFQALGQWTLDPKAIGHILDTAHPHAMYKRPFRELCWGHCRAEPIDGTHRRRWVGTKPIYPDFPEATRFFGNFLGYSFGFSLDTADPALIGRLDALIARNMLRPEFAAASRKRH